MAFVVSRPGGDRPTQPVTASPPAYGVRPSRRMSTSPAFRTIARPNGRGRGYNLLIIKLIRARGTRTYIVNALVGLSRQMHENTIGLLVISTLALLAEVDPVARTES